MGTANCPLLANCEPNARNRSVGFVYEYEASSIATRCTRRSKVAPKTGESAISSSPPLSVASPLSWYPVKAVTSKDCGTSCPNATGAVSRTIRKGARIVESPERIGIAVHVVILVRVDGGGHV